MKLPQKLKKQNGHRGDSAYLHYPLARANNGSLRCWYTYCFSHFAYHIRETESCVSLSTSKRPQRGTHQESSHWKTREQLVIIAKRSWNEVTEHVNAQCCKRSRENSSRPPFSFVITELHIL